MWLLCGSIIHAALSPICNCSSSVQHSAQTLELVGVAPAGNGHPQEGTLREVQNILYEEDAG